MDTTANVVTDRVYTGGQIASIGFEQQDLVGMPATTAIPTSIACLFICPFPVFMNT